MTTVTTDHFTVRDGARQLSFEGTLLGTASSRRDDKERWIEITIYRTGSGRYIVAGVGRTVVVGENDRCWAHVSDTAEGVVESLYMYDGDGVRYLTKVARVALINAGTLDPTLKQAYDVEMIA